MKGVRKAVRLRKRGHHTYRPVQDSGVSPVNGYVYNRDPLTCIWGPKIWYTSRSTDTYGVGDSPRQIHERCTWLRNIRVSPAPSYMGRKYGKEIRSCERGGQERMEKKSP